MAEVAGGTRDLPRPGVRMGACLQQVKLPFGPETCSSVWAACVVPLPWLNSGTRVGAGVESGAEGGRQMVGVVG